MGKLPRYYVGQSGKNWLVLDRTKYRMQNDVVETLASREKARRRMRQLNKEFRENSNLDTQIEAGETI